MDFNSAFSDVPSLFSAYNKMKQTNIKKEINEDNFLVCPNCNGTGRYGLGLSCPNCGGIGTGIFHNKYFF